MDLVPNLNRYIVSFLLGSAQWLGLANKDEAVRAISMVHMYLRWTHGSPTVRRAPLNSAPCTPAFQLSVFSFQRHSSMVEEAAFQHHRAPVPVVNGTTASNASDKAPSIPVKGSSQGPMPPSLSLVNGHLVGDAVKASCVICLHFPEVKVPGGFLRGRIHIVSILFPYSLGLKGSNGMTHTSMCVPHQKYVLYAS